MICNTSQRTSVGSMRGSEAKTTLKIVPLDQKQLAFQLLGPTTTHSDFVCELTQDKCVALGQVAVAEVTSSSWGNKDIVKKGLGGTRL